MQSDCHVCGGSGWQHPNLGVNCPAGMAWSLSVTHGPFWMVCEVCNKDRHKPQPPLPTYPRKLDEYLKGDKKE